MQTRGLRSSWVTGLIGLFLIGCGDGSDRSSTPTPTVIATAAATHTAVSATATTTATARATATSSPTVTVAPLPTETPTTPATVTPVVTRLSDELLLPGPFGVGVTTIAFVDESRPTMPNRTFAGSASRSLTTEIWYPTDRSLVGVGAEGRDLPVTPGTRYPLIMYSHGFMDMRTGGSYLARHLASYGYIVASPDFPLSSSSAPGGPTTADIANQPGDVSFLIDQLLVLDADSTSRFFEAIDADRIAVAGFSLGGLTTSLTAFHPTLRDPRVRAAMPIAGVGCFFTPQFYESAHLPLLLLHGDVDAIVPYQQHAVFGFANAGIPKYLVTLANGTHTGFSSAAAILFEQINNADDVGCGALGSPSGAPQPNIIDLLGGADAGIVAGDCPAACTAPRPLPRGLRPSRQQALAKLTALAFFESTLRGNEAMRQFLEEALASENAEITTQFAR